MNIIIKRFIAFALSFTLVMVPSFASYNPNKPHTRWFYDNLINDPTVKSTVEVKANRDYPVTVVDPETGAKDTIMKNQKTKIKIPASATKVGKRLLKGGAGAVIGAAVYDILGKAVDWVLDPENNSVKYIDVSSNPHDAPPGKIWSVNNFAPGNYEMLKKYGSPSINEACAKAAELYRYRSYSVGDVSATQAKCYNSNKSDYRGLSLYAYPFDYEYPSPEEKSIPINTVAQKVIEHANDGQAPAMQVMADTALDALEAGELDNQLESGAEPKQYGQNEYEPGTEPNPDPENPNPDPDPENPNPDPTPTEWPAFCDWAGVVCEWIGWSKTAHQQTQTAIAENTEAQNETNQKIDDVTVTREDGQKALAVDFPQFCSWATPVCDLVDWVKAEPEQTDTEIDLPESDEQPTDTNFDFGGSCPAPIVFEGSIFGQSIEFTMLDTVMLCDFLSTYVKWPVYAASSLFAIYIVGGRKEDG